MQIKEISDLIGQRNKRLVMYNDYYIADGGQWLLPGQITRSGRYLVDDLDLSGATANFYSDVNTQDWIYNSSQTRQALKDVTRKRRYAELNVIDFAIDEASRLVSGVGKTTFEVNDSTSITDDFNKYMVMGGFQYNLSKLSKDMEKFGFVPFFVSEEKPMLEDPYNFYFTGSEEYNNLEAFEIKQISNADAQTFFADNFGIGIDSGSANAITEFVAHYNANTIVYYLGGKLITEIEHGYGFSPVQRFNHGGSSIKSMMSYQDSMNIILTETSEVFKANLNPAVHIADTQTNQSAKAHANKEGENMKIERAPGSIMITDDNGKVQYITWDGLPTGTLETLKKWEEHFYNRRGISMFSDNNGVAESGVAKDEQKDQLRNIANEIRQEIEQGIQNMFNVWLGMRGYQPEEIKVLWADMTAITEQEKVELELKNYAVHGNKEIYLQRIGTFSQEEITQIISQAKEEVTLT